MMWKLFCLALSLLNTVQLCQAAPDILSEEPVAADTSGTSWQGDVGNDAADAAPNTSEVLAGPGHGRIEQREEELADRRAEVCDHLADG